MTPSSKVRGFTLIELIVGMVITAIIAGMVTLFARWPVQHYVDATYRAALSDNADSALRRIARDIRQALPNSLRITSAACTAGGGTCQFLEFIPIKTAGRFRSTLGGTGSQALDLERSTDQTFDVLGPPLCRSSQNECTLQSGDSLVLYNLGTGNSNAYLDPDTTPKANRRKLATTGTDISSLSIRGTGQALCRALPAPFYISATDTCQPDDASSTPARYELPGFRFYIVRDAVSYQCPSAANPLMQEIRRHAGYGLLTSQPTSFAGGTSGALATQVQACKFSLTDDQRQLIIELSLSANDETIRLLHQIDLYNAP